MDVDRSENALASRPDELMSSQRSSGRSALCELRCDSQQTPVDGDPKASQCTDSSFASSSQSHFDDDDDAHSGVYPLNDRKRDANSSLEDDEDEMDVSHVQYQRISLRPDAVSYFRTPGVFKFRRRTSIEPQIELFVRYPLPDEVILMIMGELNKRDLVSTMRTCKRFWTIGEDSSLWRCADLGDKCVPASTILSLVDRGVRVLRLAGTVVGPAPAGHTSSDHAPSRLTHLDMSQLQGGTDVIEAVLERCTQLEYVSLENCPVSAACALSLSRCRGLRQLNLAMTSGVDAEMCEVILRGCHKLEQLNLSWCSLSHSAVRSLCHLAPPTLTHVDLSGTHDKNAIDDDDVVALCARCPDLYHVEMNDSNTIGERAWQALIALPKLKQLALARCYTIHPMQFLAAENLSHLRVFGCVTQAGEEALRERLPCTLINDNAFSYVARPSPPPAHTSIWGERTR